MGPTTVLTRMPSPTVLYRKALTRVRSHTGPVPERRLRVEQVPLGVDRVADYSRVCGFPVADRVPAPFLQVLGLPLQLAVMTDPAFPLTLPGLVHTVNIIDQYRPVRVGQQVAVTVWAGRLRGHDKGALVDLHTEIDDGGQVVWRARSSYLARGSSTAKALGPAAEDGLPDLPRDQQPLTGSWFLAADTGRRYAAVSGDVNPIHLSAVTARLFGFRRAIAHGMWVHARSLAHLGPWLPEAFTTRVRFRSPVLLPSTVHVHSRFGSVIGPDGQPRRAAAVEVRRPEHGDDRALARTTVWSA